MKRDVDLIRAILWACEEHECGFAPRELQIEGYTDEQIGFHVHLMGEAGLLQTADVTCMGSASPCALPIAMTWDGYEFLEASRNEQLWAKAKSAASSVGGMALDVLKSLLLGMATEAAKKTMGMP